ncbi:MAG: GNAT family N-acetyltransferase [Nocardioides sp.]
MPSLSETVTAPTLTEGRVTIRALGEQDVQGCWEQCVDPLSVRWTQVPSPYTIDDARDFCTSVAPAAWADGSQWIFAVEHEGRYAGNIALRDRGLGLAEVGYGAHPAARGTGALEAGLRLLLEWGFSERRLTTVIWHAEVGNWASRKLAWRLGFSVDGVLNRAHASRGRLVDAWIGTLLAGAPREPATRWLVPPPVRADSIALRPLGEQDVARVVEACSDERTRHWLGTLPTPYTDADAQTWFGLNIEAQATGRKVTWAIVDADSDVLLGAINLFDINEHDCELGYWAHPDARGRGVMTAAARVATGWAFEHLGVQRVRAVAALDNSASRHVIEAAGFTQTGEERRGTVLRTGLADVALYDVLVSEWSPADR